MIGRRRGAFGYGTSSIGYARFSVLQKKEAQRCRTMADGAHTKLPFVEQVHLIAADLFRSKLIRRTPEMFRERLHNLQVAVHGSLRVITALEFLQHHFAKLGHRDLLVTHTIPIDDCRSRTTRVASAARAASFKLRSVYKSKLTCSRQPAHVPRRAAA